MLSDFKLLCNLLHIHPNDVIVLGSFHLEGTKGLIQFSLNNSIVFVCRQLKKEIVSQNIILDKRTKSLLSIEGFHARMNNTSSLNSNASEFIPSNCNMSYQVWPVLGLIPPPFLKVSSKPAKAFPSNPPIKNGNVKTKDKKKQEYTYDNDVKPARITFTQDYEEPKKKYGE